MTINSQQKGSSLLEVIIAATVLSIASFASYSFFKNTIEHDSYTQIRNTMNQLHRHLLKQVISPSSLYISTHQSPLDKNDSAFISCVLSPRISSRCPESAKQFPGLSYRAFAYTYQVNQIAGTEEKPVLYNLKGRLCTDQVDCDNKDYITARTWFRVECVPNRGSDNKCQSRNQRYQADQVYVYLELEFISKKRRNHTRWNCESSVVSSTAAFKGRQDNRYVYILPPPIKRDSCLRSLFYTPIAIEKIAVAADNDGCNENGAVVGYHTNGRPMCSCLPPFTPVLNLDGSIYEDDKGPVCQMNGICDENEVFRGYQVFDQIGEKGVGRGLRKGSKPICIPFEKAYSSPQICEKNPGSRLSQFDFNCVIKCFMNEQFQRCQSGCNQEKQPESRCYHPQ